MDWEVWFNLGIEQFQAGNYQSALTSFNETLALNSNNSTAWNVRGVILCDRLQRYEEAVASFDRALALKPDNYEDWYNRGVALKKLGRFEEAIASYNRALAINPSNPTAWCNRGVALSKLERHEEALTSYKRALTLNPSDYKVWRDISVLLWNLERHEEALYSYDRALALNPNEYEFWKSKGALLQKLDRYEEAIASYSNALALNPNDQEVWSNQGFLLKNLGRCAEAIVSYNNALALNPNDCNDWANRGLALQQLGHYEEAISSHDHALSINPNFFEAWANQGSALWKLGRYEEAVSSYDHALLINPNDSLVWSNRGSALDDLNRYEEAISSWDRALSLNPENTSAWYSRGNALEDLARYEEAIISWDRALTLNPHLPECWTNRGILLRKLGRCEEAIASFDHALTHSPKFPEAHNAWNSRGGSLTDLGRYEEAIPCLDHALRLTNNQMWPAWVNRGVAFLNSHGYEAALQNYNNGLQFLQLEMPAYQEGCGILNYFKGNAHYWHGQKQQNPFPYWRKAKRSYKEALDFLNEPKLRERYLEVMQNMSRTLFGLGQTQEAQELLREGTDLLERLIHDTPSPGKKLLIARQFAGFNQLRIDELVQSGKQVEALELAEERKNVCLSWLRYGWSDTVASPKYQDIQKLLNSHTAAIYWHISPAAITTFILRQNKSLKTFVLRYDQPPRLVSAEAISDNSTYAAAAHKLQDLENWLTDWKQDYKDYKIQGEKRWRQEIPTRLNELSQILNIAEILPYLCGIDQLILLPHRDLHLLPLNALFPKQFTINYLPSTQVGLDQQKVQFKVVGKRLTTSVLNVENSQDDLPYAAVESTVIAQLYPNTQHIRNSAVTQLAVTQALQSGAGIFHFSGHAEHDLNLPSESSLHLTNDERLTLRDIFELDMSRYKLVCLSACETGMTGKQGLIDEFVGLASGFLAAGTTNVVSSLWQVNDVSTAFFIIRLYENLRTCPTVAIALNQAQKWLRNLTNEDFEIVLAQFKPQIERILAQLPTPRRRIAEASLRQTCDRKPHPFANPYYWAAFTATGF